MALASFGSFRGSHGHSAGDGLGCSCLTACHQPLRLPRSWKHLLGSQPPAGWSAAGAPNYGVYGFRLRSRFRAGVVLRPPPEITKEINADRRLSPSVLITWGLRRFPAKTSAPGFIAGLPGSAPPRRPVLSNDLHGALVLS